MLITKNNRLLQIIALYDFLPCFRRFPPIYFGRHQNEDSRQNHEFTTCVQEFTAYLGHNRSRDYREHEFTIPIERSIRSSQTKV